MSYIAPTAFPGWKNKGGDGEQWSVHAVAMEKKRNCVQFGVKSGKHPLGISRTLKDEIKMYIKEMDCKDVN
jgi:hypothetical protein